jgi:hypothetical protein
MLHGIPASHRSYGRGRHGFAIQLAMTASLCALLAASSAGAVSWDIAPPDTLGATSPQVCPSGDGIITAADALLTLRRGVDLITGFSCFGVSIADSIVDVAPPTLVDNSTRPPTITAGGDESIDAGDALLILRAAVGLITLIPDNPGLDLRFAESVSGPPLLEASDADRIPTGNFPGPEDLDDGNGVLDPPRRFALNAIVEATQAAPESEICVFDRDPDIVPSASPVACHPVAPFAAAEDDRFVSMSVPVPGETGRVPIWVLLDAGDDVTEVDESNNLESVDLTVVESSSRPDLTFDVLSPLLILPATPAFGDVVTITAQIENQGTLGVTDPFGMDLFLDLATPPVEGQCSLFVSVEGGIAAGEVREVVEPNVRLGSTPAGTHALWAYVDSGYDECPPPEGGDIPESSEGNNATLIPLQFCVSSADHMPDGDIDLRADSLEIAVAGSTFTVSASYSNAGDRDLVPFVDYTPMPWAEIEIHIEVSGNDPAVIALDRRCLIHGMENSIQSSQEFPVPSDLPTTVRLKLDPRRLVSESDEDNNELCVRVQPGGSSESCN